MYTAHVSGIPFDNTETRNRKRRAAPQTAPATERQKALSHPFTSRTSLSQADNERVGGTAPAKSPTAFGRAAAAPAIALPMLPLSPDADSATGGAPAAARAAPPASCRSIPKACLEAGVLLDVRVGIPWTQTGLWSSLNAPQRSNFEVTAPQPPHGF